MSFPAFAAMWFLPFVVPICLYVAYTDLARMKITNPAVMALAGVFVVLGLLLMPLTDYLWQVSHLAIVLVVGMVLTAVRAMGAGDAKFIAAAAPYIAVGDLMTLVVVFTACLLMAFAVHKIGKHTGLRDLAPDWASWSQDANRFPMGFALGPALIIYLALAAAYGS